ncbi:MAG TPA: PQQ-binding-like beta-propeller repeat protein, partial [Pyrinomonadaceae bacterium]
MTQKLLRVWPGIVIVVLLWLSRFGIKAVIPGIDGFGKAMMTSFVFTVLLVIWWTFFSRARWLERLAALALLAVALTGTWFFRHDSMYLAWFLAYVIPVTSLAFVAWAVITRRMPDRVRHATMVATILLACGGWLLLRQDGINGDHQATFGWRWAASPEERMLAQVSNETTTPAPAAAVAPTATPAASPTASVTEVAAKSPATQPVETVAAWPGFRGPKRDGIVRGVKIDTDWSGKPPVQLWRRPVGPGWSSFAVNGDLVYTQEQRGENELVSCYKASTGQPVWTHQDAARFFESNAGAGPRATPTLSNGRVYTFGATGILNALDANNGAVLWSRNVAKETNTETPFWGFSGSPLVIGDMVIVAASSQLAAYDTASGTRRWLGPAGGGSYSSPQFVTIDGVAQVMLVNGAGVTSVAVADGKQLWEHK